MDDEKTKGKRGGRREGAGRPRSDSRLFAFRANGRLARYIDSHGNKTKFITDCIEAARTRDSLAHIGNADSLFQAGNAGGLSQAGNAGGLFQAGDAGNLSRIGAVYDASRIGSLHVPYFDISVVAGFPIPLDNDELAQDIELMKMLCPHPESSYLIRVRGDSMIEADIHTDDILIVDKSNRNPSEKQVALCELNGEYTIKYIEKKNNRCFLVPANEDFPVIEVRPSDSFSVWGVVTYIIHKPRR